MDEFEMFMAFCDVVGFDLTIDNVDLAKKMFYERNKSMDYLLVRRNDNPYEGGYDND